MIHEQRALSVHIQMIDGVKGRDSGVFILPRRRASWRWPPFWSTGSHDVAGAAWKGQLRTNQHMPFADPFVRISGKFVDGQSEVFGITLMGSRSLSFRAALKKLADN